MAERLTEIGVRKALAPVRGQTLLWDTDVKGFAVRITPGGAKSFLLDYRVNGRQRRITIGSFPDWSVQAARNRAKDLKREVDSGHDPMGQRHADRAAATLQDLWERYQVEYLPRKAPRSQSDERSMWIKIILPRLGKMKLASIDADHVDDLHRVVTEIRGTPVRANRVVEVLRRALNLAIRWKWLSESPASGVRKNAEEKRDRFLNRTEIAALAKALNEHGETTSANAIKLLMLTGARRNEVLGATWDMFDLENGIWTKPSAHTKQRRVHRVPLSGPALRLLSDIKTENIKVAEAAGLEASPYVFPGADGTPMTDIKRSWATVCHNAGLAVQVQKKDRNGQAAKRKDGSPILVWQPTVRLHDLRHSFASILVSAGASLPLIGQMLGHTQVQTTQRYAHLFDDPMRRAAETVGEVIGDA